MSWHSTVPVLQWCNTHVHADMKCASGAILDIVCTLLSLLHGYIIGYFLCSNYLDISCVQTHLCRHKAQYSTADETEDKRKEGGDYQVPHSTVEAAWASYGLR